MESAAAPGKAWQMLGFDEPVDMLEGKCIHLGALLAAEGVVLS